jgi:hypothetical protein
MYLIEITNEVTARVQEIAFGLSIIISGLFLMEYKKYTIEQERKDMLDQFLNDK